MMWSIMRRNKLLGNGYILGNAHINTHIDTGEMSLLIRERNPGHLER